MKYQIDRSVRNYLSKIGKAGGKKSKRSLSRLEAKKMVQVREAKRAYTKYHSQCFWSFDPQYQIRIQDLKWVSEQLMKNGDRKLWLLGAKLSPTKT